MARTKSHQPVLHRGFTITWFIACCGDVIAIFALTCPGSHLAPCCAAVRLFPHRTQWSCWAFLSPYIPISLHARGGAEEERQNGAGHRGGHGRTRSFSCHCSRLPAFSNLVICVCCWDQVGNRTKMGLTLEEAAKFPDRAPPRLFLSRDKGMWIWI